MGYKRDIKENTKNYFMPILAMYALCMVALIN